jgi:hypothetical protein
MFSFQLYWRWVSELSGVVFQDYLAYARSACADHQTVPRRFIRGCDSSTSRRNAGKQDWTRCRAGCGMPWRMNY